MHMDIDLEPFSSLATAAAVAILIFAGCGFGAGYSWPHDPPAARSALDGKTASPGSSHSIHVADMMNDCSGCENPHYVLRAADRYKQLIRSTGWEGPIPHSACYMCPNLADAEWIEMKRDWPEDFFKGIYVVDSRFFDSASLSLFVDFFRSLGGLTFDSGR